MRDEGVIYVAGHPLLNRRCTRLPRCIRLRNDLYCVGWGVRLYSITHPVNVTVVKEICAGSVSMLRLTANIFNAHSAYSESVSWVAWPIGEASRAEPEILFVVFVGERERIARLAS